jgi:hypothetical protein
MAAVPPPVDKSVEFSAYAALTKGVELKPWKYHPRVLGSHDVEVKITHSGICASDLHQARDGWKSSPADHYPMVPGHEIIGEVTALGAEAKKFKIGQRVGVGTVVASCRTCEACKESEEAMCNKRTVFTYNDKYDDGNVARVATLRTFASMNTLFSGFLILSAPPAQHPSCVRVSPPTFPSNSTTSSPVRRSVLWASAVSVISASSGPSLWALK